MILNSMNIWLYFRAHSNLIGSYVTHSACEYIMQMDHS